MFSSLLSLLLLINLGIHGHTYPIEEPDLLAEIEQETRSPKIEHDLAEKIRQSYTVDIYLPDAKSASKRRFGINYTVPEDLVINGSTLAKKGQVVNVLERVKLTTKYLFIKEYQFPLFLRLWKKDRSIAAVIIQGDLLPLSEKYRDHRIYMGSRALIDKFGISSVPSLVYQDRASIVVEEIPYITKH